MNISDAKRFSEDDAWTPYVVIRYQYNPADVVGRFEKTREEYRTTRGIRIHSKVKQQWNRAATYDEYGSYLKAFDKIFGGINNVSKIRSIPDIFVVVVGITDKGIYHEGVAGNSDVDYDELFSLLSYRGFDPLKTIRNKRIELSNELGLRVRKAIYEHKDPRPSVRAFAKELEQLAKNYIIGGEKPRLASGTERWRSEKLEREPSLYQGGSKINEALYESGQLHEAIESDYTAFQSDEMKLLTSDLIKLADKIKKTYHKHTTRISKSNLIKSMISGEKALLASGRAKTPEMARAAVEALVYEPTILRGVGIRRIWSNPTEKQIVSMESKIFRFLGISKINLNKRLKSLEDRAGRIAVEISKLDNVPPNLKNQFRYALKRIEKTYQELTIHKNGFKLKAKTVRVKNLEKDWGENVEYDRLLAIQGVYNAYLNLRKDARLSEREIFNRLLKNERASESDVRLSIVFGRAVEKYGWEYDAK